MSCSSGPRVFQMRYPFFLLIMLIRTGHAVRASVVFALVLLYTCQPGCWDCRRSCVRDWYSPVCWSEVDTTFPTAGSPAFLFHLRQYRTSRASLKDNVANDPLLSGVVSESCFVNRPLALRGHVTNASFKQ